MKVTSDHSLMLDREPITRADLLRILRTSTEYSNAGINNVGIIDALITAVVEDGISMEHHRNELKQEVEAATPLELKAMRDALLKHRGG